MARKWLRIWALGTAVAVAGCATAPPKPAVEARAVEESPALPPAECGAQAPSGNGVARLGVALGYGALGLFIVALRGAGEGARWALWTGGSRSDGAWIGAAAGAGVGFLIGFAAGLGKAGSGWSPEPATSPACRALAETTANVEDNTETEGAK